MCLFRKCDESVIETKEYPSRVEAMRAFVALQGSYPSVDEIHLQRYEEAHAAVETFIKDFEDEGLQE